MADASGALRVGLRSLDVGDGDDVIATWILYPARGPEQVCAHGPYAIDAVEGAACEGRGLGLIVVSHGNGGTGWTHRTTACALVRAGFVVALLEHPGNCRADNSRALTLDNFIDRPRHLSRVIDAVFADAEIGPGLGPEVGAIGHSIGGYTVLAAAGGRPSTLAEHDPEGPRPLPVTNVPRLRSLALLAPATLGFGEPGSLANVDAPIFMRSAELDRLVPPASAEVVLRGVPESTPVDHAVVPGAGHFSFQSPFPPQMQRPDFPPAHDPPGFDRAAYLRELDAELIGFFRRTLG